MFRKLRRSERDELTEASVVTSPAARLLFNIPNALLGLIYYAFMVVAVLFEANGAMRILSLAASSIALLTSIALGYDLLVRTRRSCVLCWTAHSVNAALFLSVLLVENIS